MASVTALPLQVPVIPAATQHRDDVSTFVENRLAETHPKFRVVQEEYDRARREDIGVDATAVTADSQVQRERKALEEAMRSFANSNKSFVSSLTDLQQCTWADVLAEIEKTRSEYDAKGERDKGILQSLRGKLRSFDKFAYRVEPWLQLLPADSWQGSLVCGGIKIILQAACRIGKMREDICEAIDAIPEAVSKACDLQQLHPDALLLQEHAAKLYVAILKVLQLSVEWYSRKCFLKVRDSFGKGKAYDRELNGALQAMRNLESRVDQQAVHQGRLRARQFHDHTVRELARQNDGQTQLLENGKENLKLVTEVRDFVAEMLKDGKANKEFFEDHKQLRLENRRLKEERRRQIQEMNSERKDMFFKMLRCGSLLASQDLQSVLGAAGIATDDTRRRVTYVSKSNEIARWLATTDSTALILNGSEYDDDGPDSATSLFSAGLLRGIRRSEPKSPTIYWFCGERLDESVADMLQSLTAQLLRHSHPDTVIPRPHEAGSMTHVGDLTALLCECIEAQLLHSTVFCVLDGVSFYEDRFRCRDLCYVFKQLMSVMRQECSSETHSLKLLLASPTRAIDICETDDALDAEVLDVEDEIDDTGYESGELDWN